MGLRMAIHRAIRALVPMLVAVSVGAVTLPSTAQTPPPVRLRLQSLTAWVTPEDPELVVAIAATNEGDRPLRDMDVRLSIGAAFTSRFEYEDSIVAGPTTEAFSQVFPFRGRLDPDQTRTRTVRLDVSTVPSIAPADSRVYPLRIEVRSEGASLGGVNSALISIVQEPVRPVLFSWWSEFDAPLPLGPDGRLADPGFEAAIAPGGALSEQARALRDLAERRAGPSPVDVVIHPGLLEQLQRMTDGYERTTGVEVPADSGGAVDARAILNTLRAAVAPREIQASAMPFAAPSIPALLASGLADDLAEQQALGRSWTEDDRTLGVTPATATARPPGGELSDDALGWLASQGVRAVFADPDEVERPIQENLFAPPATATMATSSGGLTLVLPDPGTQALLERADLLDDPVRAAHAVLAELAVIWREQPVPPDQEDGTETQRGLALRLPSTLRAGLWEPLVARLSRAPFLRAVPAQELVGGVNPQGPPAELRDPGERTFSAGYVEDIRRLRREVDAYASMLTEPSPTPDRLRRNLAFAENIDYLDNEPSGRAWLAGVDRVVRDVFARTTPQVQQFTFTSEEGDIPLRMADPGPVPLEVIVRLRSARFDFPDGNEQQVVLERPDQIVTFSLVSRVPGRHPIEVAVLAPSGEVISAETVFVRSTALNRIALLITGAAALMLFALWLRRWFRRRTT
jgi:hypothetical protein